MKEVIIRGEALELNLFDADTVELFESSIGQFKRAVDAVVEDTGKTNSEQMKEQIRLTADLFNRLFGEGTADKIFSNDEPGDLMARMEAVIDLEQAVGAAFDEIKAEIDKATYYSRRKKRREQEA